MNIITEIHRKFIDSPNNSIFMFNNILLYYRMSRISAIILSHENIAKKTAIDSKKNLKTHTHINDRNTINFQMLYCIIDSIYI